MKLIFDERQYNGKVTSIYERVLLYLIYTNNLYELLKSLQDKNLIIHIADIAAVTEEGTALVNQMNHVSQSGEVIKEKDYLSLALSLMHLFPEGRKEGTTQSWRGILANNINRLKLLEHTFGVNLDENEAFKAATEYIKSFNNDLRYCQTLPYFIIKRQNKDGIVESESKLLDWIQNPDNEKVNYNTIL